MVEPNDYHRRIIEEFRANGGRVTSHPARDRLLLLTTAGAKTGRRLTTPVMYTDDGDRLLVYASKSGAPTNPAWYHNLVANPRTTVEVGTERFEADATVITGEERDRLFSQHAAKYPTFAEYQTKTSRTIPVVALRRVR
jgi:deazaflavin-dependent oxidoreductase (nitroreductase family)